MEMRLNPGERHVKEKYKILGLVLKKALGIVARRLLLRMAWKT